MSVCRFCPGYECTKRLIYRILREIYFFVDIKGAKFAEKVEFFCFLRVNLGLNCGVCQIFFGCKRLTDIYF